MTVAETMKQITDLASKLIDNTNTISNVVMEDFVPFEIAKKLKEKGFNEVCYNYYEPLMHCLNKIKTPWTNEDGESCGVITAPTISQVLKWLREEKKLHITLDVGTSRHWFWIVWNIEADPLDLGIGHEMHQSYELAALAGIEYVIDNLI